MRGKMLSFDVLSYLIIHKEVFDTKICHCCYSTLVVQSLVEIGDYL